jgi:hypothetical protein
MEIFIFISIGNYFYLAQNVQSSKAQDISTHSRP